MMYETLSETELGSAMGVAFQPDVFVDISRHVDEKVQIMRSYQDEMGEFPFPRSEEAIRALARVRGSAAGFEAAEAFQLVLERRP
jgi:LmbE family N-acetylglucosaminyl deacetylase